MKKPSRVKVSILLVLIGVVGYVGGESRAWEPLLYKVTYFDLGSSRASGGKRCRQVAPRHPWLNWVLSPHSVVYDLDTGFMTRRVEGGPISGWSCEFMSGWDDAGKLCYQFDRTGRRIQGPPWLRGAKDQDKPLPPPWFYDDALFEESQ